MSPQKRLLMAILFIVVAIGIAIALYFVFFRQPAIPTVPTPPGTVSPGTGLPTAQPGGPQARPQQVTPPLPTVPQIAQGGPTETRALTETSARGATLSQDGQTVSYYNETDGRFYRITADGSASELSNKQFFNVEKINWSPNANKAVLEYPDGANVMFDFSTNEQVTLPKHWEDFSFSPDSNQIAAKSIGVNTNNRWVVVSSADGSEARAVEPLGDNADRVTMSWSPNDQVIGFSATGEAQGLDASEIYLIGKNHENFKSLIVEGRDFRPLWSSGGDQLLYSVYNSENGYRPMLWTSGAEGDSVGSGRRSIGLSTWADKCTFADNTTAYCAVPTSLPEGYGLQPNLASNIPDQIYRVDVANGTKTLIGSPSENSSISRLMVTSDGRYLFYTDSETGILRRMQLK